MSTQSTTPTATASQKIAKLKDRADHAFVSLAHKALAMAQHGALDVTTCRDSLIRRSIAYLRAQADYAEAIGLSVMAGNYRAEANALEGRAK